MCPQPENSDGSLSPNRSRPTAEEHAEYSGEERFLLLRLAHQSIWRCLTGERVAVESPTAHLAEPRGAFTTLYVHGELRGCVGFVYPVGSLHQTIVETACAAAFEDSRFSPLTKEEFPHLSVSISVISPLQPIRAEDVEVGRHGLLISSFGSRGLLLPQVPVEHGWDRETFLAQTCRKAGLPEDAWTGDVTLEAFTAEVFADLGAQE